MTKVCYCGTEFTPHKKNPAQSYCSRKCANKSNGIRLKHKKRLAPSKEM